MKYMNKKYVKYTFGVLLMRPAAVRRRNKSKASFLPDGPQPFSFHWIFQWSEWCCPRGCQKQQQYMPDGDGGGEDGLGSVAVWKWNITDIDRCNLFCLCCCCVVLVRPPSPSGDCMQTEQHGARCSWKIPAGWSPTCPHHPVWRWWVVLMVHYYTSRIRWTSAPPTRKHARV